MEVLSDIMPVFLDMPDYWDWLFDLDWEDTKRVWHFEDIYHYSDLKNDGPEPDQEDIDALNALDPYLPPSSINPDKD